MAPPDASASLPLACQLLEVDPEAEAHYSAVLGALGVRDPWLALARAIAASPGWPPGPAATLVLRRSPAPPRLAVLGSFDPAGTVWLQAQALALSPACRDLRYIDYREVERACGTLADLLLAHLGTAGVARSRFVAIPRGGLVVLGLLATRLGLRHDQLLPSPGTPDGAETLVVVDDCAVSGARLARFLEGCPGSSPVLFACLYSPAALRPALEAAEPRLHACLSAAEIRAEEFAPEIVAALPEEPGVRRFWWGSPESLCLPWNEPDRLVWNPAARRYEQAWRIVPPELCLKNRPAPGASPVPIQLQPEARGPLKPPPPVIYGDIAGRTAVCDLEAGRCYRLAGAGADLWREIVLRGSPEAAAESLGNDYDVAPERLRDDAARFARELLERGLLEQAAPAAGP